MLSGNDTYQYTWYIYIENNTWDNLYHIPYIYQSETPISARGPKARGLILVKGWYMMWYKLWYYCCHCYKLEFRELIFIFLWKNNFISISKRHVLKPVDIEQLSIYQLKAPLQTKVNWKNSLVYLCFTINCLLW